MSETSSNPTAENNRTILACQNCRQRKRRCDRQVPRCGQCARRNKQCVIPVSRYARNGHGIVDDLMEEVALLECQVAELNPPGIGLSTTQSFSDPAPLQALSMLRENLRQQDLTESPDTIDLAVLKEPETAVLYRGEQYRLRQMTRRALELDNSNPCGLQPFANRKGLVIALSSPSRTLDEGHIQDEHQTKRMMAYIDNYSLHVHPTFPIVEIEAIRTNTQVLLNQESLTSAARVETYLVLSIGAALPSQSTFYDIHASTKYFLRANAEDYAYEDSTNTITILLLMTIYSMLDSSTGNSWQLIDLAMQTCIVLGLHRSQSNSSSSGNAGTLQNNIFMTTYLLDFCVSSSLGLPRSIQNMDVSVEPMCENMDFLTPTMLYKWAFALADDTEGGTALEFLSVYEAQATGNKSGCDSESAFSMFLGFHLAIITLEKRSRLHFQQLLDEDSLDRFLLRTTPAPWPPVKRPWIIGYSLFQSGLVNVLFWSKTPTFPIVEPQLAESLQQASEAIREISDRFSGLSEHASLLRWFHDLLNRSEQGRSDWDDRRADIQLLERTGLHEICAACFQALETFTSQ